MHSVNGTTSYSYDAADRLQSAGASSFTSDNNGNRLTKSAHTYRYDAANLLTQVVNSGTTYLFVVRWGWQASE